MLSLTDYLIGMGDCSCGVQGSERLSILREGLIFIVQPIKMLVGEGI